MRVLVVDVGGSHVKLHLGETESMKRFDSGDTLTPIAMMQQVREHTANDSFDAVSIGYPGSVGPGGPVREAGNLGPGWVGFDFEGAFQRPVRVINDAVMQALGSYDDGRMLFLGLGTGLGSSVVTDRVIVPLELGSLSYGKDGTIADRIGAAGLASSGLEAWAKDVCDVIVMLRRAIRADYVVLGGGNANRLDDLPSSTRRAGDEAAAVGGVRLWEHPIEPHDRRPSRAWRILA
jgi:polyphosphate glucokinase